jgi:hypothetical protein
VDALAYNGMLAQWYASAVTGPNTSEMQPPVARSGGVRGDELSFGTAWTRMAPHWLQFGGPCVGRIDYFCADTARGTGQQARRAQDAGRATGVVERLRRRSRRRAVGSISRRNYARLLMIPSAARGDGSDGDGSPSMLSPPILTSLSANVGISHIDAKKFKDLAAL